MTRAWLLLLTCPLVLSVTFSGCSDDADDSGTAGPSDGFSSDAMDVFAEGIAGEEVSGVSGSDPCAGLVDGIDCDDGDACTTEDSCLGGLCAGSINVNCGPGESCRPSSCDSELGCVYIDEPDGTICQRACFESATCTGGECVVDPQSAAECPQPTDPCVATIGCDTGTGECSVEIPHPEGTECDTDDNLCTLESCDGSGACQGTDDQETCYQQSGANPCWTWICAPKTGCYQAAFVEGVSCDDGNTCTYSDTCSTNGLGQKLCVGEALPIDDGNPCTDDACADGQITHTPIDGIACEVSGCETPGSCAAGLCQEPDNCSCEAVDGGWSDWTWGDCEATCGEGVQQGARSCTNPSASCGGAPCEGDSVSVQSCVAPPCAQGLQCVDGHCIGACEDEECGVELSLGKTIYDTPGEVVSGTVLTGVTSVMATAWGGGGGGGFPGVGGGGSYVQGVFQVGVGDVVEVRVASGGCAYGGGGGASYLLVNGEIQLVAAGGGGAGSDGCSGCSLAQDGTNSSHGGAGGGLTEPGSAGGTHQYLGITAGGGQGADETGPGAGGLMDDQSIYVQCAVHGGPGASHEGGDGQAGSSCAPKSDSGGSWHIGGTQSTPNGGGGGGGSGYNGGGSGASKWTYSGGGGGGGSSWLSLGAVSGSGQAGVGVLAGGMADLDHDGFAGIGGAAGDKSQWPGGEWEATAGAGGLVVIEF